MVADDFHASLAVVRGLRAGGFRPVAAVGRPHAYVSRSRAVAAVTHVPDPEQAPDDFVDSVARAAEQFETEAILPASEASLLALARRRRSLPARLGSPAAEAVELATDKARVLALAAACDLPGPPSTVAPPAVLAERAASFRYPAIVKPHRSRLEISDHRLAHYDARRIQSPEQLCEALAGLPPNDWIVQPYLDGKLCAVGGVAWDGRLVSAVHQVSHRIWPRDAGYSSFAETVPPDSRLESRLAKLLAAIGWSGIFQAQMICAADGGRTLIDFNPRAYGSLALALRAGANLPALWAGLVLGRMPAPVSYRAGVRYRLEHNDVRAIVALLRDGRVISGLSALRPRPRTAHGIFSLRDPGPVLVSAQKIVNRMRR